MARARNGNLSRLLIVYFQVIVLGSILMLFFIVAYVIFDTYGIGDRSIDTTDKSVEAIVAALGNKDSAQFVRGLSKVYSMVGSLVGEVDILSRGPDGRLNFAGWVVDKRHAGEPMLVFLVVPEKAVFVTSSGRSRDDVIKSLNLPESAAPGFGDVFNYQFDCKFNEQNPYVVVVNQKKEFALIKPLIRVSGC